MRALFRADIANGERSPSIEGESSGPHFLHEYLLLLILVDGRTTKTAAKILGLMLKNPSFSQKTPRGGSFYSFFIQSYFYSKSSQIS